MDRPIPHRCNRYRAAVSLELDGELSQLERAFLRSHGTRCTACRRFRAETTAITRALRSAPLHSPARPVVVAGRSRRLRLALPRTAAVVASALVVSFGALYAADLGGQGLNEAPLNASPRPAYFESPEYELSLLRVAQKRDGSGRGVFRI